MEGPDPIKEAVRMRGSLSIVELKRKKKVSLDSNSDPNVAIAIFNHELTTAQCLRHRLITELSTSLKS